MWCSQLLQQHANIFVSLLYFLIICNIVQVSKCEAFMNNQALPSVVQTPIQNYVQLLNHSIMFYEAQRSGHLLSNNRIPWRHDSALDDGSDVHVDLSGGYYDAGDYLKFTFPLAYSIFMLSWGGLDYFEGYHLANQSTYLRDQIKWGTDWLIKAHSEPSTLFVQVGDEKLDHSYFGSDSDIKTPRPCYQINETHFGTDVAAMTAAAFASSARFFNRYASLSNDTNDTEYASTLVSHAIQLYNASYSILPYKLYQTSVPTIVNTYASSDYMDDLVLASLLLYKVTNNKSYMESAHRFYNDGTGLGGRKQPLGWDNKYAAVYVLFSEMMLEVDDEYGLFSKRIDAENYLDGIVDGTGVNRTEGGLLWWNDFSTINSNANALSTSFLLIAYSSNVLKKIVGKSESPEPLLAKIKKYEALANSQLNYVLGKNPKNQNYIIGEGPNSPKYPHSALASAGVALNSNISTGNTVPNVLYGALVGGPSRNDGYFDGNSNWKQNEVALDYNAPYQNLLAYKIMSDLSQSTSEPIPPQNTTKRPTTDVEKTILPKWVLPVSVTLSVALVAVSGFIVWKLYSRRKIEAKKTKNMTGAVSSTQFESNIKTPSIQRTLGSGSTLRGSH